MGNDALLQLTDLKPYWKFKPGYPAEGHDLIAALQQGWAVHETVIVEEYRLLINCEVALYDFMLARGDETRTLTLMANPTLRQMVAEAPFRLVPRVREQAASEAKKDSRRSA